jgi:hypothetical protein
MVIWKLGYLSSKRILLINSKKITEKIIFYIFVIGFDFMFIIFTEEYSD